MERIVAAIMSKEPSHPFWDHAIRLLLRRPERIGDLLSLCDPELAGRLDFGRAERLECSFVHPDFRGQEADFVLRVPYRSTSGRPASTDSAGGEVIVYLLLEHQSSADRWIQFRLLAYMMGVWDTQRKEIQDQGGSGRLSPIIPIIFHTGSHKWKAPLDFRALVDGPEELRRFWPGFDIMYIGLPEIPPAALEAIGPVGWTLRTVQGVKAPRAAFAALLKQVVAALEESEDWADLINIVYAVVLHTRKPEERHELQDVMYGALRIRQHKLEFNDMGETIAEALRKEGLLRGLEEGLEKGLEEGLEKGREEGREEGIEKGLERGRAACRSMILRQGRRRFGEPSAAHLARLEAITDLSQLEDMSEKVLNAASWDEFLSDK